MKVCDSEGEDARRRTPSDTKSFKGIFCSFAFGEWNEIWHDGRIGKRLLFYKESSSRAQVPST